MKRRIIALLLIAVLAVSVLAGCGAKSSKDSITALFGSEPTTMDPGLIQTLDAATYAVHFFEGLTRDDHGKFVPGVAKSWDISDDLKTYTFHLRDNAVWSDGQPVKAQDFEYAFKRNLDPRTASAYAYIMYYIEGGEEFNSYALKENPTAEEKQKQEEELKALEDKVKVKALDDKTLEVTLLAPANFFLEILSTQSVFFPLRKDIVEANSETWTQSAETFVTNGAYKLKEWKHSDEIVAEKSDNYWDKGRVTFKEIHFKLMDDDNAALNATEAGEIDVNYAHMPTTEIPRLEKEGKAKIYPDVATYYYDFNVTKPPFDNPKVRKAIAYAIDRQYIIDKVTLAYQKPAIGMVPYGFPDPIANKDFREADPTKYLPETANVEEAKKLLAEAGYPDGKNFPEVEFIYNTSEGHRVIAEAIQEQLKTNLGISVKLTNMEWAVFVEERNKHNFNFCRDGFGADYSDPISLLDLFTTKSGNNSSAWSNAEYDALIDTIKNTDDQKVRFDAMHKAEKILMEDMPIMPIYFYTKTIMEPSNLKNQFKTPTGLYFLDTAYFE
jgi:oligopeptide transport system substrate-binding protein